MLDLKELLLGDPMRLSYVFRFGTTKVMRQENVAEHSYYVALYTMVICCWIRENHGKNSIPSEEVANAMAKALVHDLEESRSGDFPRLFKYSDPRLRQLLEETSGIAADQITCRISTEGSLTQIMLKSFWRTSKDDSVSGRIVEFADFLSVLSYVCDEVRSGNKKTLLQHMSTMRDYYSKFYHEKYQFLLPLVEQAGTILSEEFEHG